MKRTLVVGVGSILRADDGIGPRVIDALAEQTLDAGVSLQRGDLGGLDLLKFFPGHERIILIDAADMGSPPGTIRVFSLSDIRKSTFRNMVSTHGMGLLETLTIAEQLPDITGEIIVVGIQPKDVGYRLTLSDTVNAQIPALVRTVEDLLAPAGLSAR